jgi:DNA-binding MarR family transcriptional regulator
MINPVSPIDAANAGCPIDAYHRCLFFSTQALARDLEHLAAKHFQALGMSPSHAYLLKLAIEHPGCTTGRIVEVLSLAPSTVTRLADSLVAQGLLERTKHGKQVTIAATEAGEALKPTIATVTEGMFTAMQNIIGGEKNLTELSRTVSDAHCTFKSHQNETHG